MGCMGEHIHGLNHTHFVICIKVLQVARLGGRVATDVYDTLRCCPQNGLYHVRMHTCTRGVGDDDIRAPVLCDKFIRQDILHIAGKEKRVIDAIDARIDLRILNGLGHILDTNHLAGFPGHEVGDGASAGVEVVD